MVVISVIMCLLLILSPRNALEGARGGVAMCISSVIPSLLPFMIASSAAVKNGVFSRIRRVGFAALLTSLLGGYGVGVKTVCDLYECGSISKRDAEKMLAYSNNSGPLFIIAFVGCELFCSARVGVLLFVCHAAGALFCALLFGAPRLCAKPVSKSAAPLSSCVRDCCTAMLSVCAFVILFGALINVLPIKNSPLLLGIVEITAALLSLKGTAAFPTAALILAWGGISVHCQAASLCAKSRLSLKYHTLGKITSALVSAAAAAALIK